MKPSNSTIRKAILQLLETRGEGKTICPSEVARTLAGDARSDWEPLIEPVRPSLLADRPSPLGLGPGAARPSARRAVGRPSPALLLPLSRKGTIELITRLIANIARLLVDAKDES